MTGKAIRIIPTILKYIWTSPNTFLGIILGIFIWGAGGQVKLTNGAIECYGGSLGKFIEGLPDFKFTAITFGHTILSTSHINLCAVRAHETVHVRQYERWGILFLPAYFLSSFWQLICGKEMYRDNYFEKQAYAASPELVEKMFGPK